MAPGGAQPAPSWRAAVEWTQKEAEAEAEAEAEEEEEEEEAEDTHHWASGIIFVISHSSHWLRFSTSLMRAKMR